MTGLDFESMSTLEPAVVTDRDDALLQRHDADDRHLLINHG